MSRAILSASFSCSVFVINLVQFDQWPNKSPEPTVVGAVSAFVKPLVIVWFSSTVAQLFSLGDSTAMPFDMSFSASERVK